MFKAKLAVQLCAGKVQRSSAATQGRLREESPAKHFFY
jgi:hypothetical protein